MDLSRLRRRRWVIQLATLAAHVQEMLAADHPLDKTPVGLTTAKNQRRRAMEAILVLLADPRCATTCQSLKGWVW